MEECGLFYSLKLPYLSTISQQFCHRRACFGHVTWTFAK